MPARFELDHPLTAHLLDYVQAGVIARFQLLEAGATDSDIERLVRRRELTVAHPGVYVAHSGPLTRSQREWVALLSAWPAALADDSALPEPQSGLVHIAVANGRSVRVPEGVRVRRMQDLDARIAPRSTPPRIGIEHAVIDVMTQFIAADDLPGAFATLARSCFRRRTTPDRILHVLAARSRVPGRRLIEGLLTDLRDGACSVLERGYLQQVERAHGLPRGSRQVVATDTGRRTEIDVRYDAFGLRVELDGTSIHDSPEARDADARRDLAGKAARDDETVRVTYGLVFRTPCWTAGRIAEVLRRRGWPGELRRCPRCP